MSLVQRSSNEPTSPDVKEFKFGSTRFLPPTTFESAKRTIEELMLQATTSLMRKAMHFEDDHSWELYSQSLDAYEAAGNHLQLIATEMELKKRQLSEDGNISKTALAEATTSRAWTLLCNCALNLEGMECGLLVAQWPKWHEDVELVRIAANKTFEMAQRVGKRPENPGSSNLLLRDTAESPSPRPNKTWIPVEFTPHSPNTLPVSQVFSTESPTRDSSIPTSPKDSHIPEFQVPASLDHENKPHSSYKTFPEIPVKPSPLSPAYEASIIENETSVANEDKASQEKESGWKGQKQSNTASLLRPDSVSEPGHEDSNSDAQASHPHPEPVYLDHEYQRQTQIRGPAIQKVLEKSMWDLTPDELTELAKEVDPMPHGGVTSTPEPWTSNSEHDRGKEDSPASSENFMGTNKADLPDSTPGDSKSHEEESLEIETFHLPAPPAPMDVPSSSTKGPVWNRVARQTPSTLEESIEEMAELPEFSFSLPSRTEPSIQTSSRGNSIHNDQPKLQARGRNDFKVKSENQAPQASNVISLEELKNRFDGARIVKPSRLTAAIPIVHPDSINRSTSKPSQRQQPDGYSRRAY